MRLAVSCAAAAWVLLAAATATGAEPAGAKKITTVGGITEYLLDNGLHVLLFPDESRPSVTVNCTYLVGSRFEGYGETGMAHLLEHMLFKGTPDHPQVWKALQDHGANFNGSTNYDRTNYFETMTATEENLDFGLELEADRMVNSFVAKKDLESEFSVVRNEFEMGENNPLNVLSERMMSTAYLWHNYGKSTIGSREDIERVPIERLQAFYRKYYQPDNAYLIVTGKFDEPKTLEKIVRIYGKIPRPERKLEATYTVEPPQDGEREVALQRVGNVQAIGCVYHVCSASHEDAQPLDVLSSILTAEETGLLYKALIETKLATSVRASSDTMCDPGAFEVMVEARPEQSLPQIRAKLLEVLDTLGKQTFTAEQVQRAQRAFARNFELMMADSGRVATRLSGSIADGDWRLIFLERDRMAKVTPADVQRVAAYYFKPSNRTIGVFTPQPEPDRARIPESPNLAQLLKDYKDTQEISKGEVFEASYANIEAHTKRSNLPGGMKLALLPKQTRGDRVAGTIVLHFGSEQDLAGKPAAAGFLAPMLMRGTAKHSRRQLEDRLAELKAQVRVGGGGMVGGRYVRLSREGPGTLDVSIETTRENLAAVLDLVAEILREPAFPQDEFDTLQREMLSRIEQQKSDPNALANNTLQRKLNPYPPADIRYVPTPDESLERTRGVTLADVQALYKGLVGASFSEAAFVGDFDAEAVAQQLGKLFDDWKSPKAFVRVDRKYQPVKPDVVVIETPDKANSMVTMGAPLELRDDDPDYPAMVMGNVVLGAGSGSRLLNRLRQKEGWAYGCGSMASCSSQDKYGTFLIYSICAPQNAAKAVAAAEEELKRLLAEGIPQKELDDARKGFVQQVEVSLGNDGTVAGMLAGDLYLGRTLKFSQDLLDKIKALTPEQVQAALVKYLKPDRLVVVRAGDFAKAEGAESPSHQ